MRKDEEYAKDLMVDRLSQGHSVTVEKGKEPPDYFFIVDGIKYAVDVTWLVQSRIIKGRKVSRRGEETGFSRWLSTIESELIENGLLHGTYTCILHGDFGDLKKHKDKARKQVKAAVITSSGQSKTKSITLLKSGSYKLTLRKVNDIDHRIYGVFGSNAWGAEIQANAKEILRRTLDEKRHKMRNIQEPCILILINDYWLTEPDNYRRALSNLQDTFFEAIYIVHDNECSPIRPIIK
jgi:hypothetical protein